MGETWEEAVLAVLSEAPDRAWTLAEIYGRIEERPIVSRRHREIWGSHPNFHHWVRSTLARLKRRGLVLRVGRVRCRLPL